MKLCLQKLIMGIFIFVDAMLMAQTSGVNTGVFRFLDIPVTAKDGSLGTNQIALNDRDLNLSFNNPALISNQISNQLAFNYVDYLANINYGSIVYCKDIDKFGPLLFGLQYVNYGKIQSADPNGQITGNFSAADYALSVSLGRKIDSLISVGINLKAIYSHLDVYSAVGTSLNIGATYIKQNKLEVFSLVFKNLGYQWIGYQNGMHEPLPYQLQFGYSRRLSKAPFRFGIIFSHLEKWNLSYLDSTTIQPAFGSTLAAPVKNSNLDFLDQFARHLNLTWEIFLGKSFMLRAGYNYQRQQELKLLGVGSFSGFSLGFGFKLAHVEFNYGYAQYSIGAASNHFSLIAHLNEFYK